MKSDKIIYSLNVKNIQDVANEILERNLSPDEIQKIVEAIEEKIKWHDVISESINEEFRSRSNLSVTEFH